MKLSENNTISTRSLFASAYLVSQGFELVRIDSTNPHRCYFLFPRSRETEVALDDFYGERATVNLARYLQAYRGLRDQLFSLKQEA